MKKSAKNPAFTAVQDAERDRVYFNPAIVQAKKDGLGVLGQFIYYDAMVMHGPEDGPESFGGIRSVALTHSKTPSGGGDQAAYLNAFLDERVRVMHLKDAHDDTSRVDTAQRVFVKARNFNLDTPLNWKMYGEKYRLP